MAKIDETCGIGKELYQKGYSQAEKDYFAQSQKDREDTYNCGYAIGRQDAIEECISKLDNLYSTAKISTKYPQYDHYCNGIEDCIDMLEQLKEQKND